MINRTKPTATQPSSEIQTGTTPTGAGDIQLTGDSLKYWGITSAAVITMTPTATPGASKIPIADGSGKLASGWGGSASTLATLNGSSKVVEDPANATATPTASKIPIADSNGDLDNGWVRDDLMKYAAVALTAQNILDMFGAPVTLIAAPGANKAIIVHDLVFEMKRSATAFANGGAVSVEYTTGDDVVATIAATVVTGAAGTTLSTRVMANLSDTALASIENDALRITNATAAFITGTGTADVHIWYSVIDVTP